MLFQQEMRLPIDNEVMPKEEGGERLDVGFEDDEDCEFEELLVEEWIIWNSGK